VPGLRRATPLLKPFPRVLLAVLTFFAAPLAGAGAGRAEGGLAAGHTEWSGRVVVEEDLLVPRGAVLRVQAGTRVIFAEALSTKTEPWFWNPGTELAIDGRLEVLGTPENPVVFEGLSGPWGGVVAGPGAEVVLSNLKISGADEAVLCAGGGCRLDRVQVEGAEYGLVLGPGATIDAQEVEIRRSRVGVLDARLAPGPIPGVTLADIADADRLVLPAGARMVGVMRGSLQGQPRVEYVGEYTVERDETWRGEVTVSGRVTVVPGAVLTLDPGTRVAFRKIDSNGDGLGEGELLVLGGIVSRGVPGRPVVFDSAEAQPAPGDWDKVSLIAAEFPDSRFHHTVFRYGTQALHAHFSRLVAEDCLFEENLRALQFQESDRAEIRDSLFRGNKQALRFRDSTVRAIGNFFLDNLYAVHAFRCDLEFSGNTLEGSALGGFLAKESRVAFEQNRLFRNREGARMKDLDSQVLVRRNRFLACAEDHLSLSQAQGAVEQNAFDRAGLDLVSLEDSAVVLRRNHFGAAGRDAVHLKGGTEVDAPNNHWGTRDPDARIHDRKDDPYLGSVRWAPPLFSAPMLDLPRATW